MIVVVGAGLAGLAAALDLHEAGRQVRVLEAGPAAGGRARSYEDRELGCRIDNGNHLLLSGNRAAMGWLKRLGTEDTMTGPGRALFPFLDLGTDTHWTLQPGAGLSPMWLFDAARRVPGTRPADYLQLLRWLLVWPGATVREVARPGALFDRLIEPLAIAALNTMPDAGDAGLMAQVVRQTLLRGGDACVPAFPSIGLSESLIDPAIARLPDVRTGCRVTGLAIEAGAVAALNTNDGPIPLAAGDAVVLAVPAPVAAGLLPALVVPDEYESILNLHFQATFPPGPAGFIGLVGGFAEWIFFRERITSVTVSAANRYADLTTEQAAERAWPEILRATGTQAPMPAYRVIRERRATFAATPAQARRRPEARVAGLANVFLAGDWTATGLPATIEGALRSGATAAGLALAK